MYGSGDQKLILLVDDDSGFHRDFAAMLSPKYRLLSAYNPSEALRLAKIETPYVALMDLHLPLTTAGYEYSAGLELLEEMHKVTYGELPIIMLIDCDIEHGLCEHILTRARGIIKKPREMKALLDEMERCLG